MIMLIQGHDRMSKGTLVDGIAIFTESTYRCVCLRVDSKSDARCLVLLLCCLLLVLTQALTSLAGRTKHKKGTMGGRHAPTRLELSLKPMQGFGPLIVGAAYGSIIRAVGTTDRDACHVSVCLQRFLAVFVRSGQNGPIECPLWRALAIIAPKCENCGLLATPVGFRRCVHPANSCSEVSGVQFGKGRFMVFLGMSTDCSTDASPLKSKHKST